MSKLLPASVAEVIRTNTDVLINSVGLACLLYKISTEVDSDVLGDSKVKTYGSPISTFVAIHWSPEIRRLRSLGLYQEGAPLPILAYFEFTDDVNVGDYIELEKVFATGAVKTNKFQVVDIKTIGQSAETRQIHILSPKRV